ncbi:ABC1 kinase family protein [Frondihabitans australicus]|uniref:Ubiquinone biosynthesis protein n=1 Tax=Frondihabitans australicus TaxID=386892 RepID=A0A495IDJ8_9MICO|nr:AarF/UbiB family protein [Frondihabitans australicus]RKR73195.1 ubiquinone biosynthesis protein [Frondihabitans australicus]
MVSRGRRFAQVVGIARRHGLLPVGRLDLTSDPATRLVREAQADHLRQALEEAGGAFVKLGQLFSTRSDMLPDEYTRALSRLQQSVTPAPWGDVKALLEAEYGSPLDEVFASFDEVPIAAASLGQVHRAILRDTREPVAVKVQRPGIEDVVRRDVDIALRFASLMTRVSANARSIGLDEVAKQYTGDLLRQLDFDLERRNLQALRAIQRREPDRHPLTLPEPHRDLSTRRVFVMEFVEGETLATWIERHRHSTDGLTEAMRLVLHSFLGQMVIDGLYHADLHPGNIILMPDGSPALVDFGSVGRLDNELKGTVQELLVAYLQSDTQRISDGLLTLAAVPDGLDERAFRRDVSVFVTYDLGPGAAVDVDTVDRLVEVLQKYRLTIPAEFVAAARALAILEGTLRSTVPDFDLLEESREFAREQIRDQVSLGNLGRVISGEVIAMMPGVRRLPRRVDRIGEALETGRLSVNLRLLADRRDRRTLATFLRQTLATITAIVCGVLAIVYLTQPAPASPGVLVPAVAGGILGGISIVLFAIVAISFVVGRRRD